MSKQQQFTLDFTQGELSPKFKGRFDLPIYYRGALLIENAIPQIPGGFSYRGGFYRPDLSSIYGKCRIHPFIISKAKSYVVEFDAGMIRFWENGGLLRDGDSVPIKVDTPYTEAMLSSLWFAQGPGCLIITTQGAPVKKLSYNGGTSFSFSSLAISGNAGDLPFQPVDEASGDQGNWPALCAFYQGRLYLANSRNAPSTIWASEPYDYGNFTEFDTVQTTANEVRESAHSVIGGTTSGSTTISGIDAADLYDEDTSRWLVKAGDRIWGEGIIEKDSYQFVCSTALGSNTLTNISSSAIEKLAVGETVSGSHIPQTTIVSIGADSVTIASPATATDTDVVMTRAEVYTHVVSVAATSLVMDRAATATNSAASLITGWKDPSESEFEKVVRKRDIVADSNAFEMEIAGDTNEIILSLGAGKELVVQSCTGERIIPPDIAATNLSCVRQTAYGAEGVQPFMFGDTMLFVEAGGKSIREYFYRDESSAYTSPELTFQAKHLFSDGIVEMDYQNTPLPIAWFVLKTGELRGCVYSRNNGACAFFRLSTPGGTIEDIAVVPGEDGDDLYACILRGNERSLERLGAEGHLDAARYVSVIDRAVAISGLSGAVTAIYNGTAYSLTVASGSATVPEAIPNGASILVGIPYEGTVKTMPANAQTALGPAQMRPKAISRMIARVLDSYHFKVGQSPSNLERADFGQAAVPVTGDYPIPIPGTWDTDGSVVFRMDEPFDVNVLAVSVEIDVGG